MRYSTDQKLLCLYITVKSGQINMTQVSNICFGSYTLLLKLALSKLKSVADE